MGPEPKEIAEAAKRERNRRNNPNSRLGSTLRLEPGAHETDPGLQAGAAIYTHLAALGLRDDGYLRMVPDGAGKAVYWKWKFSRGEWAGHYVMSVVSYYDPALALLLLRQKIDQVEVGLKRPAKDTPHET